jgi:hypothetical protein
MVKKCRCSLVLFVIGAFVLQMSAAYQGDVVTATTKTISFDVGPNYAVTAEGQNTSTNGTLIDGYLISNNSTKGDGAYLAVVSVYDPYLRLLDNVTLSRLFLTGIISASKASGGIEAGAWTAKDAAGNNVTFNDVRRVEPFEGGRQENASIACWSVEKDVYIALVSFMSKDNTDRIAGTIRIV